MITKELSEPIYVEVTGMVNSIYTLTASSIHKDHPISSALTLAEDIEYEMKILPYQFANV